MLLYREYQTKLRTLRSGYLHQVDSKFPLSHNLSPRPRAAQQPHWGKRDKVASMRFVNLTLYLFIVKADVGNGREIVLPDRKPYFSSGVTLCSFPFAARARFINAPVKLHLAIVQYLVACHILLTLVQPLQPAVCSHCSKT